MTRKNLVLLVPWAFTYMENSLIEGQKQNFSMQKPALFKDPFEELIYEVK